MLSPLHSITNAIPEFFRDYLQSYKRRSIAVRDHLCLILGLFVVRNHMVSSLAAQFSSSMKLLRMIKSGNCYEYINSITIKILW